MTLEANQGRRKHLLLTAEIKKRLPGLDVSASAMAIAQVKFFSPYNGWTWWAQAFDGEDIFYGLVQGWEIEFGTFSYRELQETMLGNEVPAVERDCYWTPRPIRDIYNEITSGVRS